MRRVFLLVAVIGWIVLCGLVTYEIVQKSPGSPFGALPGAALACRADRQVRYRAATGVTPLDRLLHEGEEAALYYRDLALGRAF